MDLKLDSVSATLIIYIHSSVGLMNHLFLVGVLPSLCLPWRGSI